LFKPKCPIKEVIDYAEELLKRAKTVAKKDFENVKNFIEAKQVLTKFVIA
jgi:ElaB/YqjD/DUF883 family membrane-anchored ribosome-binding protein